MAKDVLMFDGDNNILLFDGVRIMAGYNHFFLHLHEILTDFIKPIASI